MSYALAPIFAVPFAQDMLVDTDGVNASLRALLLQRAAEGARWANPDPSLKQQPGVFESNFDLFASPDDCIQRVRRFAWTVLGRTVAELNGYSQQQMAAIGIYSHSWFHVTRDGGFTILHTHPMASWSGVYCVAPGTHRPGAEESGVLRFHNPHHFSNYFQDPGNAKPRAPYHHGTWNIRFVPGQLVLFPSWLQHEVMPFHGDDERITIAFNCWFKHK